MVVLHSVTGPPGSDVARAARESADADRLRPLVGPFVEPVMRVAGPEALLEEAARGLPEGAARAEALAVRLRRRGVDLVWGEPDIVSDTTAYVEAFRARGESSVEIARADPSLVSELQVGSWFNDYWPTRVRRRVLVAAPRSVSRRASPAAQADAAFWSGVRALATDGEWSRFTRSSYVVLTYHRIAGEGVPGQERLDVDPARFERQLRLLRSLGFHALSDDDLAAFHEDPSATLPSRCFVLTADDGFRDAVAAVRGQTALRPQLFVNTDCVGGVAPWGDDRPLAGWQELRELAASGASIGSHARTHGRLPLAPANELDDELAGSLRELRAQLPDAIPVLAYPHGSHDERVRAAAIAAGYRAAFTTETGRNGAGTDRWCLRRVGVKDWDGALSMLWKATTGELVPPLWDRATRRLRRARRRAPG